MCGIAGKFNYLSKEPVDSDLIRRMCDSIRHRGPDEDGCYVDELFTVGLGHRRLSILDIATGQQPMSNATGDVWIVFNGEIYNFPELKAELQRKNHQFRTTSDTEVIIHLYEEYGERAFSRLNGIFAFAIYDGRKRCLLLARDHFGVKPLYYTLRNGSLIFGSEIKAILQDPSVPRELDYEAFNSFLTFRYNPSPGTLFKDIQKLYPGYYFKITSGGAAELHSYWDYVPTINRSISEHDAIEQYQTLLENAVRRQMLSDVPVGLLLSGGIDSAVVGYLMQQHQRDRIKTFTIGFAGKGEYNELDDARRTAEFIGSEHFELTLPPTQYVDFFLRSFHYTEEPIAEPTIPALYYVSKLAASHVKVVLAGQGADEPLAGYHRYVGEKYISTLAPVLRMLPLKTIAGLLPRNERFKRASYASQFSGELQRFVAIYTIFTSAQKEMLLADHIKKDLRNVDEKLVERLYSETGALNDTLSKLLFVDTRISLADNLLLFGDKMTMANSLEMRVPFLDLELVCFLESLPSSLKLRGRTGKYIHKKALQQWLPRDIILRKKRGFATPMDEWLQGDFADTARKLLNAQDSASRMYFNIGFVNQMLEQHQSRRENFERHIFALLSFELWHKTFFEGKSIEREVLTLAARNEVGNLGRSCRGTACCAPTVD